MKQSAKVLFFISSLLLVIFLIVFWLYFFNTPTSERYYAGLRKACERDECCLASLQLMEERQYKKAPGTTLKKHECGPGMEAGMISCPTSYIWCYPQNRDY